MLLPDAGKFERVAQGAPGQYFGDLTSISVSRVDIALGINHFLYRASSVGIKLDRPLLTAQQILAGDCTDGRRRDAEQDDPGVITFTCLVETNHGSAASHGELP